MLAISDFLDDTDISVLSLISFERSVDCFFFLYVDYNQSIKILCLL